MADPVALPRRHSLGDIPRRSAARMRAKIAIRCGSTSISFAEFEALCSRVAAGLHSQSVGAGDRVAILSRNSHAFAAIRFAVARLGAVLVPINYMLKAHEIAYLLCHSGARLLCLDATCWEAGCEAAAMNTAIVSTVGLPGENTDEPPADMSFTQLAASDASANDFAGPAYDALAQIIYTSGTESLPKGAMLTHDAILWEYVSCLIDGEMQSGDVVLHAMPLYHCAQLDVFLGPALYIGSSSIITAQTGPEKLLELLESHCVTSFFAPPTVWIGMLRSPSFADTDLTNLRKGYYGASIMPVEVLLELKRVLPEVRFYNLYGQTEIAPVATVLAPQDQLARAGSAGIAALNVETRVVDDNGNDVGPGEVGEVVHRSPQLMIGYYNDADRTAEAFRSGWFHSGDLATRDADGYLTIVDRKKDMIKTGGENVASREVEEVLYCLPGIKEVAVIGLPHPLWVEAVVAVVVLTEEGALASEAVIAHARAHLAHFKAPRVILFATDLPKNPSGKIMKRALREQHLGLFS
jgi:fatty-acyl-CoA synthase